MVAAVPAAPALSEGPEIEELHLTAMPMGEYSREAVTLHPVKPVPQLDNQNISGDAKGAAPSRYGIVPSVYF